MTTLSDLEVKNLVIEKIEDKDVGFKGAVKFLIENKYLIIKKHYNKKQLVGLMVAAVGVHPRTSPLFDKLTKNTITYLLDELVGGKHSTIAYWKLVGNTIKKKVSINVLRSVFKSMKASNNGKDVEVPFNFNLDLPPPKRRKLNRIPKYNTDNDVIPTPTKPQNKVQNKVQNTQTVQNKKSDTGTQDKEQSIINDEVQIQDQDGAQSGDGNPDEEKSGSGNPNALATNSDAFEIMGLILPNYPSYHASFISQYYNPNLRWNYKQLYDFIYGTISSWTSRGILELELNSTKSGVNKKVGFSSGVDNTIKKWFATLCPKVIFNTLKFSGWIHSESRLNMVIENCNNLKFNNWWIFGEQFFRREFIDKYKEFSNMSYQKFVAIMILVCRVPTTKDSLLNNSKLLAIFKDPFRQFDVLKEIFNQVDKLKLSGIKFRQNVKFFFRISL